MSRKNAVHFDATKIGDTGRTALCGYIIVDTDTDITRVTCKDCLKLFAKGSDDRVDVELAQQLAPKAPAPPRMNPALWAATCRGEFRCNRCVLCLWESEANKWADPKVSAHNREHHVRRAENATRWPKLDAALVALAEWERHDRFSPSALGGILTRIEFGSMGDGAASRPDDRLLHRAGELVRVRQSLEAAYPPGVHATLSRAHCMALLLARTPGVLLVTPSFAELAALLTAPPARALTEEELKALVRNGRESMTKDLATRGLIPVPRVMARRERGASCQPPASRF